MDTCIEKLYVDDIADLQEALFEEVTRYKYEIDYENFVKGFMSCKYRRLLDDFNTRVANMTWDELLMYIENDCKELLIEGNTNVVDFSNLTVVEHIKLYLDDGMSEKDAIKLVAKERNVAKSIIYKEYHLGK